MGGLSKVATCRDELGSVAAQVRQHDPLNLLLDARPALAHPVYDKRRVADVPAERQSNSSQSVYVICMHGYNETLW